jgi:nucleotidyltransferase substrate binding protein (TIGR01987 family)
MIDYDRLEKLLKHLQLQYENYKTIDQDTDLTQLEQEAVAESVVHRFETCYDCLWEVLKRYLSEELGVPEMPNSPKPIFQIAFENMLLSDIVLWKEYANARIDTSHEYSGTKALNALDLMDSFIPNAIALYEKISGKTWK